jgi:signal transduction histidine kinase
MPRFMQASRSAGRKLATILLLLLVPVLGLLYVVIERALTDIRLTDRQTSGIEYLERTLPVLSDLLADRPITANATEELTKVPAALALRSPGLAQDAVEVANRLRAGGKGLAAERWRLRALIRDTAIHSELMLGSDRRRQLLSGAIASGLPDLVMLAARPVDSAVPSEGEIALLSGAAFSAVSEAVKSDSTGQLATILNTHLAALDTSAEQFAKAVKADEHLAIDASARLLLTAVSDLSAASLDGLGELTANHRANQKKHLVLILIAVGLATAVALSVAFRLVGATFRKLDMVEAAKRALEKSEAEARAFADEMQRLNSEIASLNKELANNYKVLKETQDDNIAKSNMAQLGSLTAMVAHELRNPLGAVRTSSFLIEKLTSRGETNVGRHANRINHAVGRCDAIISQLLNYANTRAIDPQVLEITEWLSKALVAEAANLPSWLEIQFDDQASGLIIDSDPVRLQQSISNILTNSCQALESQREQLTLNGLSPAIRISLTVADNGVRLDISDNGPGIPADKIELVTTPLFTTKSFGPGLGLAFVDQVVKLHHGKLSIQSDFGQGTTVAIWLLTSQPKAAAA